MSERFPCKSPGNCECQQLGSDGPCWFVEGAPMIKREPGDDLAKILAKHAEAATRKETACAPS